MKILLCLLCFLFYFPALAAKPLLSWCSGKYPPFSISEGERKGQGINELIVEKLQPLLTHYQHTYLIGNTKRILFEMSQGREIVCVGIPKTAAREELLLYGKKELFLMQGYHIVILKSERDRFTPYLSDDGSIDLSELFFSGQFTLGISGDRAYPDAVTKLIRQYDLDKHVVRNSGSYIKQGLFKMLERQRIDFTFSFPVEAHHIAKQIGIAEQIDIIPIAGEAPLIPLYVVAPKTKWGEKMINEIEGVYSRDSLSSEFTAIYESWLDKKSLSDYRKKINLYYSDNQK